MKTRKPVKVKRLRSFLVALETSFGAGYDLGAGMMSGHHGSDQENEGLALRL